MFRKVSLFEVGRRRGMDDADENQAGSTADAARQVSRLRRIEGQVRGLQQMVEAGRSCPDVTVQVDAVIGALRRVRSDLIRGHLQGAVRAAVAGDLSADERRRLADELDAMVSKVV